MKKNLFYRSVFRRSNPIKGFIFDLFRSIASWPRLLLEVFIRKNFGRRYFSFSNSVIMAIILAIIPYAVAQVTAGPYSRRATDVTDVLTTHFTWYLFLAAFLYFAFLRKREIAQEPYTFDLTRFTDSTGDMLPFLYDLTFRGKRVNVREVETIVEPLLFFAVGIVFTLMGQIVGILIILASIVYSLSYRAAYRDGDNFIMDKMDEILFNQQLFHALIEGVDPRDTRGINFYGMDRAAPDVKRQVAAMCIEDEAEEAL
jgi:hypothetical protein